MKDSEIKIGLKKCLKAFCIDKDTDSPHYRLKKALEDAGKEMFVCPFTTRNTSIPRKYAMAMKRLRRGVVELELYTLDKETIQKGNIPGMPRRETMRICEGLLLNLYNYEDKEGQSCTQFLYYTKQAALRVYSDVEINKLYKVGRLSGIVYRNTL